MKSKIFLLKTLFALLLIISSNYAFAQPTDFRGDFNSWGCSGLTDRGNNRMIRFQETVPSGGSFKIDDNCDWGNSWGSGGSLSFNTRHSGALTVGGGNSTYTITNNNYYTFIIQDAADNLDVSILETSYNPNTITSVSQTSATPDNTQTATITTTLSAVLNTSEYVFVRYTIDAWTNSTLVAMSFVSGTTYSGTIPAQTVGTTVDYYVLTSNNNSFASADADYFTLEFDNNAGSNYSYTVVTAPLTTAQNGDWNTAATWTAGSVPPAGAKTQINHAVSINGTVTNSPNEIEITASNSITFGASGDITVNNSIINNGTIDMTSGGDLNIEDNASLTNNSSFIGGIGKVTFLGTATVSGLVSFYDAEVQGAVDFGGSSSINNILEINGGYLNSNSITYNAGSTLRYSANYNINSGDKSWYSNVASSGSAQEGIPWNVEVPVGITVQLNDSYPFSINGNILIDGTFRLGTSSGGHFGNFLFRGNFTNNGTFNPNGRETTYNGTANQNLTGATTFDYFKMDGSGTLNLNSDISINNTLNFVNGKIILGANNLTVLSTGSISGGNSSSYAITDGTGYLIQDIAASEEVFPVGTSTSYAPAYLTQNGTQENLYVRVKEGIDNATNDDDFVVNLQWTIDESNAGNNNIITKFQWNASDENSLFDNEGQLKVARYITGAYATANGTVSGSDPYTATAVGGMTSDISAEVPFILGNNMAFSASGYRTAQNGNWATATTWIGGVVPPANSVCAILHHVIVNSTLNSPNEVTIYENKSVTFQASGVLTVNGYLTNHGMLKTEDATASITINGSLKNTSTASVNMIGNGVLNFSNSSIFTNEGSFTAGTGTVNFLGAGSASGTLTFNKINISGNVDLGADASLNDVLTISGTGDLVTNSITYLTGSILKFDRNYSLANNLIWYRNVDATGSSQKGIPWNVEIPATRTVDISDAFFRAINGNIIINGQFDLSMSAGGDFKLKGNFENNGVFNHNSRLVEFYGNGNQNIKGSNSTTFAYVKINNTANVTLEKNTIIANDLDFTLGKIILSNFDLNISIGATISNYNSLKYVATNGTGYLIQNINVSASAFYPVGTMSGYNPANLSQGASATQDDISVRVNNSVDNAVNDPTQIVNMQWTLNEAVANGNDLTTQFYWNLNDEAGSFTRGSGSIETRYYTAGAYSPLGINSTIAGADPYDATAGYVVNIAMANLPFIVADASAFTGGIISNGTGNWSVGATWLGGSAPVSGQSAIIRAGDVVTLDINPTVKSISIQSTATLTCGANTITLDNGGAIANSGTFNANAGKVIFSGNGSISTGSIVFNDVDLNGAVSFGSSTTIGGTLSINSGGSVNINAPFYAVGSILKYNQGGNISRSYEWQYNIAETDPGYPANVQVSNSTILDVDADANDDNYYQTRFLRGNLTIDALSQITLNDMGGGTSENQICGLYAKGNIVNKGIITLSSNFGGDLMFEGDLINTGGTINFGGVGNERAIFFTGDNDVNQNVTDLSTIPFVLITRGANVILQSDMTVNGSGSEFITFARPSSTNTGSIDLNGNTLTCSGAGNIELNNISGAEITSSVAGGRVEVSGGNATFSGTGSGTLNFGTSSNTDVTLAINGGTMTFPSTLGIVTVFGTLEIGDNATISNIPTYGNSSTLHYKKAGSFTMGVEWGSGSNVADNIPKNVTVSQGSSSATLNMNATRNALGTLLIENNATLEVADATGQLTVNNLTVDTGGKIVLKSPNNNGVAGSFISTGAITNNGTMQAERYIPANKYVYVTPPNNMTNSQMFTNNANGTFNPNFYYYNQAFDAIPDPATGTYGEWDANNYNDAWVEAHDNEGGSGIILNTPGRGYAYFNDINKMFVFDGTFNTGDINTTIYYDANDANSGYFDGWNLIANPFPSALDWNDASWDKTYVDAAIYYWDGTSRTGGNYKYYAPSGTYDDGTDVVNGGSQFIPASQAFFVKAKTTAGTGGQTLTIPNNARKHNTQDFWSKSSNKSKGNISQFVRLQINANGLIDELVARYINEASINYDGQYDAYKVFSSTKEIPQIYSYNVVNGSGFALNSLPLNSLNENLHLGIEIAKRGETECTLKLSEFNITGKHIYLEDLNKKSIQNLRINSEYNFTIADSSDIRDRFEVYFTENHAPIASVIENKQLDWSSNFDFSIPANTFTDEDAGDVLIYEAKLTNGNDLPEWISFNSETLSFTGNAQLVGDYDVMIVSTDIFGSYVSQNFSFEVNAILPQLQTNNAENISTNSVTVGSILNSDGGENISNSGICWNTTGNPTISDNFVNETYVDNEFSAEVIGLNPNTTYYARSYAENSAGINYGNEISFTTSAVGIIYFEGKNISLFPNPVKDILFVNSNNSKIENVKISDLTGKVLRIINFEENKQSKEINLRNLASGVYLIEIKTKNTSYTEKLVVE